MPRMIVLVAIIVAVLALILVFSGLGRDGDAISQQSGNPHAIEQQ